MALFFTEVEAMRNFLVLLVSLLFFSPLALGRGSGHSSYPMLTQSKVVGVEFTGVLSDGGGLGVQGRYTQKASDLVVFDAGFGTSGGERSGRLFGGLEYEFFPDYGRQPRFSLRGSFETAREFGVRKNILTMTPKFSKGFSFWGTEGFPFLSLPVGVGLNSQTKTYETMIGVSAGINGNLPWKEYKRLVASAEVLLNLQNSFTGVFVGISYPLD